jgi:hypothetical protein
VEEKGGLKEDTKKKLRPPHSLEVRSNLVFSYTLGKTFYL